MPRNKKPTLGQIAIKRVGFRKGSTALGFAAAWWITTARLGRSPVSVEEYAGAWNLSVSQAYREQAIFRVCFPECATPTELAAAIGYEVPFLKRAEKGEIVVDLLGWSAP